MVLRFFVLRGGAEGRELERFGAYHTCGHLCRYCYANDNAVLVRENRKHHNPNSPFLIGESRPEDVIHQAKQEKWLDTQMSLFDYIL